jgi:hypothetical protein
MYKILDLALSQFLYYNCSLHIRLFQVMHQLVIFLSNYIYIHKYKLIVIIVDFIQFIYSIRIKYFISKSFS